MRDNLRQRGSKRVHSKPVVKAGYLHRRGSKGSEHDSDDEPADSQPVTTEAIDRDIARGLRKGVNAGPLPGPSRKASDASWATVAKNGDIHVGADRSSDSYSKDEHVPKNPHKKPAAQSGTSPQ